MRKYFEEARDRINKINWDFKREDRPSYPILVSEFIRSGNIFLDYNECNSDNRRAIFNASSICKIELPININDICTELNEIKDGWAKMVCGYYLEWSYLIDLDFPVSLKFKNLYDPIIKLYERGGRIGYHHNELICGKYGWSRNSALILRNTPQQDISDEVLDEMDNGWYYKEISNIDYLEISNVDNYHAEEVAEIILKRLQESTNTLGENVIILTVLGELLLNNQIHAHRHLKDIKLKLEQFNTNDFKVLLPETEKKDLYLRIEELLFRLNDVYL